MPPPPQLYKSSAAPTKPPPPASLDPSSKPATAGSAEAAVVAPVNPEAKKSFDPRFSALQSLMLRGANKFARDMGNKADVMTHDEYLRKYGTPAQQEALGPAPSS